MTTQRTLRVGLTVLVLAAAACAPHGKEAAAPAERRTPSAEVERTLAELRARVARERLTFEVGYTDPMEVPLENLAGTVVPPPAELKAQARRVNALAKQLLPIDRAARDAFLRDHPGVIALEPTCPNRSSFDWRRSGKVTPVKSQGGCGSCWDFAAMGAFESSYAIRNTDLIDTSEQQILECATAGSCCGGWYAPVFDYLIGKGVGPESAYSYRGCTLCCNGKATTPYKATVWGFVDDTKEIPSVDAIKQAICDHGGVAVAVLATDLFQAYTSGVFNEHDTTHGINHAVTLVGWDDAKNAWLMKNSWGTGWGETGGFGTERGYMWIAYDSNNVGTAAAWVDARSKLYVLPHRYEELIRQIHLPPEPGPLRPHTR